MFTSILSEFLGKTIEPVWQEIYEQKGAKRGYDGCKEHLLLDRVITADASRYKRNLSMSWVDYRKAFDMTSHALVLRLLAIMRVPHDLVRCIKDLMLLWKTRFTIGYGKTAIRTGFIVY
jgi:hypothetical protein